MRLTGKTNLRKTRSIVNTKNDVPDYMFILHVVIMSFKLENSGMLGQRA